MSYRNNQKRTIPLTRRLKTGADDHYEGTLGETLATRVGACVKHGERAGPWKKDIKIRSKAIFGTGMSGTLLVGHSLDDSDLSGHYASATWITRGKKEASLYI